MQDGRLRALLSKMQEGNQFAQTHTLPSIVTCPLTGTRSEKCILNRFCHSVSVAECTYIQADSMASQCLGCHHLLGPW